MKTLYCLWILAATVASGLARDGQHNRNTSDRPAVAGKALLALSQIESGDNDRAVGGVGELSRWQVRPEILRAHGITRAQARNPRVVGPLVARLWTARAGEFERAHGRRPTAVELYALWNAPAQALRGRLTATVRERAQRFANLYEVLT